MAVEVSHGSNDSRSSPSKKQGGQPIDLNYVRSYLSSLFSGIRNRVSLDTVRPLTVFLGLGPSFCFVPMAYSTPTSRILDNTTPEKIRSRMRLNFAFFISNYALVAAGVGIVVALMHPGMLVSMGLVWALWGFHNYLISNELVILGHNLGMLVSISHRSNALMLVTAFVIVWKCLVPAIIFVAISGCLILAHAIARDPKHTETSGALHKGDSDDETSLAESEVLVERPMVRGDVA